MHTVTNNCKKHTEKLTQIATDDEETSIQSETKKECQKQMKGLCKSAERLYPRTPFNYYFLKYHSLCHEFIFKKLCDIKMFKILIS